MTQPDDRFQLQAPINQKGARPHANIEPMGDHIERDKQAPLRIEDFEYELPVELIAQQPLPVRHQSRLLHLDRGSGAIEHLQFESIVELLEPGDVLVVNNTKVIPARLTAKRKSGGQIKLLLLQSDPNNAGLWEALVTPIKRLKPGEILTVPLGDYSTARNSPEINTSAESATTPGPEEYRIKVVDLVTGPDGFKRLLVDLGTRQDVFSLLTRIGSAPLPPYIRREGQILWQERICEMERYQTVYAIAPGAVAAPTAGLHFSKDILAKLEKKGVILEQITLHVGAGTFKPIEESVDSHTIERENFSISTNTADTINKAIKDGRRIIAVGTTSLRALESAAKGRHLQSVENSWTNLYVKPGHDFKIVDGLVTNFHLSRSSLLVLGGAYAGRDAIMRAYAEAVEQRYRFYSYGDATLII